MTRYVLDTNAAISVINKSAGAVSQRVKAHEPGQVVISSLVIHEPYFGAHKSIHEQRSLGYVDQLNFSVIDFDQDDARRAGQIRAYLSSVGTPIGPSFAHCKSGVTAQSDRRHCEHSRVSAGSRPDL